MQPDETHDAALESWVESANEPGCDFPIQNLPFGVFKKKEGEGIAARRRGHRRPDPRPRRARHQDRLDVERHRRDGAAGVEELRAPLPGTLAEKDDKRFARYLLPMKQAQLFVPVDIGDYTDFFTGIHHATNMGRMLRPDNPLLPNYKWVPIGYHGRAPRSS